MNNTSKFYQVLKSSLSTSTAEQRKKWAVTIIEENLNIKTLSELLKDEKKIAKRFLWMLSDIGILNPDKLFAELPYLFNLCESLNSTYKTSFASYWLYVGVPEENEGKAVELLFQLLLSPDTNVTIKARSFLVLYKITEKYPELKNELKYSLKDQLNKYSKAFDKRVTKILILIDK